VSERGQKFRLKGSEMLNHMVALGRAMFSERLGIDEETATEVAREYAHQLATHFGGQLFYFPKDLALTLMRRDMRIFEEFTGTNHEELARRYNLTVARIYFILDRVRREDLARRQRKLFPSEQA